MGQARDIERTPGAAERVCKCGTRLPVSNTGTRCGVCQRKFMTKNPPLLKELLRKRHLLPYRRFCREYERVARGLDDKNLAGTAPSERQYARWLSGDLISLPYSEPCAVLEGMFPEHTAEQLFAPPPKSHDVPSISVTETSDTTEDRLRRKKPSRLRPSSSPSISVIRAMSDSFQLVDRRLGGGKLYRTVSNYLSLEIAPYLLDPPADCSPNELFSAAASMTEMAGWMAHDGGADDRAKGHFANAYRLAVAGDNAALSANVCASMAHLAVQLELPDDAERISQNGLKHAIEIEGAEHLVARLYAMQARAHAMRGHESECHVALDTARESLPQDNNADAEIDWVTDFDEASLAGESALCFLALGVLNQADQESRKVIQLRAGDRIRSRALGQLTLATVLMREGVYDEAARVGLEICSIAPDLNSARVHNGLSMLGIALTPRSAISEVSEFLTAQTEACRKPAVTQSQTRWPV